MANFWQPIRRFRDFFDKVAEFMTLNEPIKNNWLIMSYVWRMYVRLVGAIIVSSDLMTETEKKVEDFQKSKQISFLTQNCVHVFTEKI